MTMRKDILVGRQEIVAEPRGGSSVSLHYYSCVWLSILHIELDVLFNNTDARDGHPKEPITLSLLISVSPNAASSSNAPVRSAPDSQTVTSRTELRRAEGSISTIKTWKRAVGVIKLVMDTVGPIAAVCLILFLHIHR
jgi:hypothetical protein